MKNINSIRRYKIVTFDREDVYILVNQNTQN